MKRIFIASAIVVALAAGYGARSLSFGAPPDAAAAVTVPRAQREGEESDRPQWEYCAVTRAQFAGSVRGNQYWIVYFRPQRGVEIETVEGGVSVNAQGRAIHKLGQEGWEFAGEGVLDQERPGGPNTPPAMMFKRPRR